MKKIYCLIAVLIVSFAFPLFAESNDMDVAVFNPIFKNCSDSEIAEFESVLRGRLVTAFSDYSRMNAFDGTTRSRLTDTIRNSNSSIYDERTVLQAGRQLNATYMCYVKIIKIGYNQFNIYYNLLETETGIPIATFEDDCDYNQIVNTNQNSITNRAVYKMLYYDLGREYYVEKQLYRLQAELADQQANAAKYEARERQLAAERAQKEKKKAEQERREADKNRRQAESQQHSQHINNVFMNWQKMNPTSGIDVGGGFNSRASVFDSKFDRDIFASLITIGAYVSPTPFWGTGCRFDIIPLGYSDYYLYNISWQIDSHIVIANHIAPYCLFDVGYGRLFEDSLSEEDYTGRGGVTVAAGAGMYFLFSKSFKVHGEYSLAYNTKLLGWNDRVYFGLTWNPLGVF